MTAQNHISEQRRCLWGAGAREGAKSGVKIAPLCVPTAAEEEGGRRRRRGGCASAALLGGRECHGVWVRQPGATIQGWIAATRSEYQNDNIFSKSKRNDDIPSLKHVH
jgi:hypothetical protein